MKQFIFAFLFFYNLSFSNKIEGYYININNEKVNTIFNIPVNLLSKEINFEAITFGIKYYDEKGEKQKLNLKNVKEIGIEYLGEKIILKCLLNTCDLETNYIGDTRYVLLKPLKIDVISVFLYPKSGYSPGFMSGSSSNTGSFDSYESTVLVKANGIMVEPLGMGSFKNKMKAFFYDCPDLVKKIEDNTYKRKHITEMIEDYTKNCVKAAN